MSAKQAAAKLLRPLSTDPVFSSEEAAEALRAIERVIDGRYGDPGCSYTIDERVRIMFEELDTL